MHTQLFLSQSALRRMLQIRLLTEFRPIDEPITYKGVPCYLDGFEISDILILPSERPQNFVLSNLNNTETEVVPMLPPFSMTPVMGSLVGNVLLSPVSAVQTARLVEAPAVPQEVDRYPLPDRPLELRVPIIGAQFDLFFTVSPQGIPALNVSLQELPGADQLGDAQAFLDKFKGLSLPFPVGVAFADVLTPNRTRVLNAGLRLLGSDGVVMRFEFEPVQPGSANDIKRQHEWFDFFNVPMASELSGNDWAIDFPTGEMAEEAGRSVDEQFEGAEIKKVFSPTGGASANYFPGWPGSPFLPQGPGFALSKEGIIESACGGLDVRATVEATILLSVPAPNTLRVNGTIDIDLNDWDSFKCLGISLINPFAGMITTFDWGAPWWAFFPISILLPLSTIVFGLGGDDFIVKEAISQAQDKAKKGQPVIVRTSKTTFYADVQKQIITEITRDWLVIKDVRGVGDRLILGGEFTAPDIKTLPRLRGTLTDPFGYWSKKNRCSTSPQYYTTATISLGMEEAVEGTPIYKPIIPIRYGIDIENVAGQAKEVGQVTWRIIDDPAGVYRGLKTRVHWTGNPPGAFEIEVDQPPDPFASAPYPFRMQLFTSYGVREFEIPAPPPVPKRPTTQREVIFEEAERISECYVFSSLLNIVKALQVHWLPMPTPDLKVGQHWQALVRGVGPEERVSAWNAVTRDLLAEVTPYNEGLVEVSLVMPPEMPMRTLQLTRNDAPFLREQEYLAAAGAVARRQEEGPNPTLLRQTPLYLVAQLELDEMALAVAASTQTDSLRIHLNGREGSSLIELDLLNPGYQPRLTRIEAPAQLIAQVPSRFHQVRQSIRNGKQEIEIVGLGIPGDELIVARYVSRPWYDRGCVTGRFFVQLSEDGLNLSIYRRGITHHVAPDIGPRR